jgi:hypothetical protein
MSYTRDKINTSKRTIESNGKVSKMYLRKSKKNVFNSLKSYYESVLRFQKELTEKYFRQINPTMIYLVKKSFFNRLEENIQRT